MDTWVIVLIVVAVVIVLASLSSIRAPNVAAGALVPKDVPPYAIVAGVPARFMRWREGHEPEGPDGRA